MNQAATQFTPNGGSPQPPKKLAVLGLSTIILTLLAFGLWQLYDKKLPLTLAPSPQAPPARTVPGSCIIFEEQYCSKGEIVEWQYQGQIYRLVGFRIGPDVPIFSPIDGQVGKTQANEPFTGFFASVKDLEDANSPTFVFIGDLGFDIMLSVNVKRGDVIGHIQNTGVKNFKDYNLVFRVTSRDPDKQVFTTDEKILFALFPMLTHEKK